MLAYILVQLKESDDKEILTHFSKFKEVKEAHLLFGEWDLLLKVDAANENALGTFVIEKVRKAKGVEATSTMIVAQ